LKLLPSRLLLEIEFQPFKLRIEIEW